MILLPPDLPYSSENQHLEAKYNVLSMPSWYCYYQPQLFLHCSLPSACLYITVLSLYLLSGSRNLIPSVSLVNLSIKCLWATVLALYTSFLGLYLSAKYRRYAPDVTVTWQNKNKSQLDVACMQIKSGVVVLCLQLPQKGRNKQFLALCILTKAVERRITA